MFRDILVQKSLSDSEYEMIFVLQNTAQISRNQNVMTSILVFGCKFSLISPQILDLWLIEGEKQWSSAITVRMWNKWAAQQTCVLYFYISILAHICYIFLRSGLDGNAINTKKNNVQYRDYLVGKQGTVQFTIGKRLLVFRSKIFTRGSHS